MFDNAVLRPFIEKKTIQAKFCFTASVFSEIKKQLTENVSLILHLQELSTRFILL